MVLEPEMHVLKNTRIYKVDSKVYSGHSGIGNKQALLVPVS